MLKNEYLEFGLEIIAECKHFKEKLSEFEAKAIQAHQENGEELKNSDEIKMMTSLISESLGSVADKLRGS